MVERLSVAVTVELGVLIARPLANSLNPGHTVIAVAFPHVIAVRRRATDPAAARRIRHGPRPF